MNKIVGFIKSYKVLLVLLMVGILLASAFYWYEWRPSQIKKECFTKAQEKASELLKTKAEMSDKYKELAERDLYLKDDFEQYYKNCLRKKGL